MDWLKRMNDALVYLEENLDGEIEYAVAAQKACCSLYHFQRIFSYMAEIPLSEYIRRRRLTQAAFDLQSSREKVIDIALKYGYDSPTAFTRAFQNMHGVTPHAARDRGVSLKSFAPISFQVSIKGATIMNYRIEEKAAFRIVGKKITTTMENGQGFSEIPKFWGETARSGALQTLIPLMDGEPSGMLGVSSSTEALHDENKFDYYIAVTTTKAAPEGFVEYTVPAATWAIFDCTGPMPGAIQELQKRIVTEWLPTSGYEYGSAPDIEVYISEDGTQPDAKSQVWIPIVKKLS